MTTAAELASYASSFPSFRNRIINGDMRISQRYGEANPQNNAGGSYHVDRFGMYYLGNSYTTQQSTTAPDGFLHSLKLTVDGTTTPTYSFFGQRIEGLNVAHLGFGKSWAKTITISFWVRSSVTGVYSIAVTNGNGDRAYAVQYTINAADTWEQKTATIAGDTTGTWLVNNANGLYLRFNLGSPSGRLISADSWQAANADGATSSTGADTWATTSGATFYITGVQLEEGTVPTPFEHRPYGTELALCQRYFQSIQLHGLFVFPYSVDYAFLYAPLLVPLRSSSSVSLSKTARVIRITTPEILDYHIDGGSVFNGSGDWLNTLALFGKTQPDGGLSNLGIVINKSGSGTFPDQEPLLITGIVNSTQDGYNSNGGYLNIECEL